MKGFFVFFYKLFLRLDMSKNCIRNSKNYDFLHYPKSFVCGYPMAIQPILLLGRTFIHPSGSHVTANETSMHYRWGFTGYRVYTGEFVPVVEALIPKQVNGNTRLMSKPTTGNGKQSVRSFGENRIRGELRHLVSVTAYRKSFVYRLHQL